MEQIFASKSGRELLLEKILLSIWSSAKKNEGARGVMVIIDENELSDTSSNPTGV